MPECGDCFGHSRRVTEKGYLGIEREKRPAAIRVGFTHYPLEFLEPQTPSNCCTIGKTSAAFSRLISFPSSVLFSTLLPTPFLALSPI